MILQVSSVVATAVIGCVVVAAVEEQGGSLGPVGSPCQDEGRIVMSCGKSAVQVRGRALQVGRSRTVRPVRRVSAFRVIAGSDENGERLEEVKVTRTRGGYFQFPAVISESSGAYCKGGMVISKEETVPEVFVLRADGCVDARVEVSKNWQPQDIVMRCQRQD